MPQDQLRRLLCFALPWVQILTAFLPALGIGQSVGVMSAASQTPVIPAGYAFPIMWTLLFALSVAYGVWQVLRGNHASRLASLTGWPLAGAFAANSVWQTVAQLSASNGFHLVAIILVSLACALAALFLAHRTPEPGIGQRLIVRPLVGLLAGWLTAATFANISGAARAAGMVAPDGLGATVAAVILLLAAGGMAAAVAWLLGRDAPWYVAGIAWALVAVAAANLGINGVNVPAALVALLMLALVAAVAWGGRGRAPRPAVDAGIRA